MPIGATQSWEYYQQWASSGPATLWWIAGAANAYVPNPGGVANRFTTSNLMLYGVPFDCLNDIVLAQSSSGILQPGFV
jgi:hypothetical protein